MNRATFFKHFELLADQPDGVAKMRELVLELAVRGQLLPQVTKDEPASELLKRTEAEKANAIKAGEIRKQEPLPPVGDDAPFDVPKSWEWTRLGNTGRIFNGNSVSESGKAELAKVERGLPFIATKDVGYGREALVYENGLRVPLNDPEFKVAHANAVLICAEGGSAGKKLGIADRDICFGNKLYANEVWSGVSHRWIFYVYQSPAFFKEFASRMTGIIGGIARSEFHLLPIPIPPESEQRRIVAKVDELMALCDELEQRQQARQHASGILQQSALHHLLAAREPVTFAGAWQRVRDHFHLLHDTPDAIPQLRQAILQLAVQGRLLPQNPKDEPAEKLLARLRARNCPKGMAELDESNGNKPFDLPPGWVWARFPELGKFSRGKSRHRPRNEPSLYSDGKYPLVQTGDVARAKGIIRTHTGLYNEKGLAQSKLWPPGTMCITIAANIAETGILGMEACIPDSVVGFIPDAEFGGAEYFEFFMRTAKAHLQDFAPSTAQKNINMGILESVYIPFPPLAEQKRIVARVEELLRWCDTLEAQLHQTRTLGAHLLASTLHHLLAA